MTLIFLSVYKKTVVNDVLWYSKTNYGNYVFQVGNRIYFLDKKNNLLLKVIYNKGERKKNVFNRKEF